MKCLAANLLLIIACSGCAREAQEESEKNQIMKDSFQLLEETKQLDQFVLDSSAKRKQKMDQEAQ